MISDSNWPIIGYVRLFMKFEPQGRPDATMYASMEMDFAKELTRPALYHILESACGFYEKAVPGATFKASFITKTEYEANTDETVTSEFSWSTDEDDKTSYVIQKDEAGVFDAIQKAQGTDK